MEANLAEVKKRSVSGVLTLTSRTLIFQIINLISYFLLTIFLKRSEFGIFIIVSAIIDILGYFSDIGLAAALVQKKEEPTIKEIRSTFTIQQILIIGIILILLPFSPLISKIYGFNKGGMLLLYSFALAFFFSSLKTIPSVLLERKLKFSKIVIPQLVETIAFNLIVVILAWRGFGLISYTIAVLARGLLGTLTLYIISPWPIGLDLSFSTLKSLLKFGIPYQINSLLAVAKDKIMILFLGAIIGNEGIALIGWAEKWATTPLRYLLDNTVRVAFPAFSRLQHDQKRLEIAIEKTLYFLIATILPALLGIALLGKPVIDLIPRLQKWQPALIPLYIYCFASIWGSLAVFITTIFNSIGKIKTTFKLMILWTVLTWLLTPILAWKLNIIGVAIAISIVNFSSIIGIIFLNKMVKVNFVSQITTPGVAGFIMFLATISMHKIYPANLIGILARIGVGFTVYTLSLLLLDRKKIIKELFFLKKDLKTLPQ